MQTYRRTNKYSKKHKFMQSNHKRNTHCVVLFPIPPNCDKESVENFVKEVLAEEKIHYDNIYVHKHEVFIDLFCEKDQQKLIMNRKYSTLNGYHISFNKKYTKSLEQTLYINYVPKHFTRKEIDDILTEKRFDIHSVTKMVPSYENNETLFVTVQFNTEESANDCYNSLTEIEGYQVVVYRPDRSGSNSAPLMKPPPIIHQEQIEKRKSDQFAKIIDYSQFRSFKSSLIENGLQNIINDVSNRILLAF